MLCFADKGDKAKERKWSWLFYRNGCCFTKRQIPDPIKVCLVCATPLPKGEGKRANKECGVKVRIELKALNWWMFYPKKNG
jgi:hypothetical protein